MIHCEGVKPKSIKILFKGKMQGKYIVTTPAGSIYNQALRPSIPARA